MNKIENTQVCVIGGLGFLGSHLVEHLVKDRGCEVLVLDNCITGQKKNLYPGAKFEWFDIRDDESELVRVLKKHDIKFVFNYAAEPYIPECFERPKHFFLINALGVLNVLNAVQSLDIPLLQVSSAEIYGNMDGKISENDKVEAHSTYGVAKMAADGLVQVRWREGGVKAIAMRQFNCVGERETHEYVIPVIIEQIAKNGPKIKLGNNSFRDFQYAGDAVRMAVLLLENGKYGEVYNMGSQDGIKIYDLAQMIGEIMGHEKVEIEVDPARVRPWEIWHLQSDNTKLFDVIGCYRTTPLKTALEKTINYYFENGQAWDF